MAASPSRCGSAPNALSEGREFFSEDEGRRRKRREKNRVAAQKSRRRQTQRADLLHQACELLEARKRTLQREVDSLSEEQQLLTDALAAHQPLCPIMPRGVPSPPVCVRSGSSV